MKPNLNDWCEASLQIWIGADEAIHYDSLFEKRWPGSFKRLLDCVENNIDDRSINWVNVQNEYLVGENDENAQL
ncbi:hypothetical protein LCGC14_2334750 [marine sediment metagenome]|uniref:Uncharacterized protein n=1 Tax=marine sediment metagenome TaxID=412755 RepID=A0A0F9F8S8_9ZZZZ